MACCSTKSKWLGIPFFFGSIGLLMLMIFAWTATPVPYTASSAAPKIAMSLTRSTVTRDENSSLLEMQIVQYEQRKKSTINLDDESVTESSNVQGEISDDDFESPNDVPIEIESGDNDILQIKKLMPEDRPSWIGQLTDFAQDTHVIAVATEPASSIEKSLETLDESLVRDARRYVVQLAQEHGVELTEDWIASIDQLDESYIRKYWMDDQPQYDLVLNLPSGEYHQRWQQLAINKKEQRRLLEGIHGQERLIRMTALGGGVGILIGGIFLTNLAVGGLSKRQRNRKKS